MRDCKHERYSRPDAYCPDCDVSWEIVERDQRIAELEAEVISLQAQASHYGDVNVDLRRNIVELEQLEESNGELRREMDAQLAKLEKVADAAVIEIRLKNAKGWLSAEEAGVWHALRAAGYLNQEK